MYPDLITDKLCYCFASITAMFFPLTIVTYKRWFEQQVHKVWMLEHSAKITDNFRYAIRNHSRATANQHLRCNKEGKWDTKEDKGKSMMHAL